MGLRGTSNQPIQLDGRPAGLDQAELTENTLIILSSDNGPVVDETDIRTRQKTVNGHIHLAVERKRKYSAFEGGTAVRHIALATEDDRSSGTCNLAD